MDFTVVQQEYVINVQLDAPPALLLLPLLA
jgi:hypothetical protein